MRVVVTGSSGLVGRAVMRALEQDGHAVSGWSRSGTDGAAVDLLDNDSIARGASTALPIDCVVHCAALTHGQTSGEGETTFSTNLAMVRNLCRALGDQPRHWVFTSSVAVYGNCREMTVDSPVNPIGDYALSKTEGEELLRNEVSHLDIVRLCPVYDEGHLDNVRKRAFLPGTGCRIKVVPNPATTFCRSENVGRQIADLVARGPAGQHVHHVEGEHLTQLEMTEMFTGPRILLPAGLFAPAIALLDQIPGSRGAMLAWNLSKLLRSAPCAAGSRRID